MNYSHALKKQTNGIKQNQVTQKVSTTTDLIIDNTSKVKPYISKVYKEYQTYPVPPLPKVLTKAQHLSQDKEQDIIVQDYFEENSENNQSDNNPSDISPSLNSPSNNLPILSVQPISNMKGYYKLFDDQVEQVYNERIIKLKSDMDYYDSYITKNKKILSEQIEMLNKQHQRLSQNDATIRYNIDFIASQQQQINTHHNLLLQQNTQIRNWEEKINQLQSLAQQINSHIEYQKQVYMQQQQQQQQHQYNYQPSLSYQNQPVYEMPQLISQDLINNMSQILASMLTYQSQP
jgi:hypothetical protein